MNSDFEYYPPKKRTKLWIALVALVLLIAVGIGIFKVVSEKSAWKPIALADYSTTPQLLTGITQLGTPTGITGLSMPVGPPRFEFLASMVVEARVVRVLSDVYQDPLSYGHYRLLELEVLDSVTGQQFPKTIYYRIGFKLSAELDKFDSLLFSLHQVGMEEYLLLNETTNTLESFSFLFETADQYMASYGSVMAFTDGILDLSLWELTYWNHDSSALDHWLSDESYPGKPGCTLEQAKKNILNIAASYSEQDLRNQNSFTTAAGEIYAHVKAFDNGAFVHQLSSQYAQSSVTYTRLINGFPTTEQYTVSQDSVKRQGEAFTAEDLKSMPDLTQILSSLDLENMTPPNTNELDRLDILKSGANGWYTKVGNRVYGIIRVSWTMCLKDEYYMRYFDDIYYLATSDGQYRQISRNDLQDRIGNDPNISTYGYNEPMPQPVA